MESEDSRVKRARVLSLNQIREIVMDSDSDEEKYYACEETEEEQPGPSSRRYPITQPASPDFSASSSSDDEEDVGNVTGQQAQEKCWHGLGMIHDRPCLLEDQPKHRPTL